MAGDTEYRILQDGVVVAWANSISEALHYAAIYAEDGPVKGQQKQPGGRWKAWLSVKEPRP